MKSTISISKIELNGTENSQSRIISSQHTLKICIEGYTEEEMKTDIILIIKNKEEVPLAALAEGHSKGILQHIKKGKFRLESCVQLPKYLNSGDCIIDILMHHPMVEYQLRAINCAEIHIDGYREIFGRVNYQSDMGLFSLESIK